MDSHSGLRRDDILAASREQGRFWKSVSSWFPFAVRLHLITPPEVFQHSEMLVPGTYSAVNSQELIDTDVANSVALQMAGAASTPPNCCSRL